MRSTSIRSTLLIGGVVAAATLSACGGGGGGGGSTTPVPPPVSTMGTLNVALTDAPACGFDAVNVTVTKVRVNKSATASETDAGWTDITLATPKKINLLNLTNGVLETLGQTSLEAGQYNQLRLVLDPNTGGNANTVVVTGITGEKPLETPSAVQSGIKLVGAFNVKAGQRADVVIDFDACKSVVTRGGRGSYALKPVVKMLPSAINGISGFVSTALLANRVTVSAQQNGNVISATTPNPATGEFLLSRLAPGNYDVVITADNSAASVVGAVPVASTTSTTTLSTAAAPIQLATSATGSIGGTVTMTPPSTEAAYVAAKQTFGTGSTVTIRYQGADLATGAYTVSNLPVAAPLYAVYAPTLPLSFVPAANVTGGVYRVDASATGYVTKSADAVNIGTANVNGVNFTLTP